MISLNYINGLSMEIPAFDPFNVYESEVSDILDDIATAYESYKEAINEYNLSVEFFEAGDDAKKNNVAEKKTNFVDKIGDAVINIAKKAVAFINNIITKIQETMFAKKSDMQKVSALCKQNPGLADDINKAFASGDLKVADLKNVKELENAYNECIKLAKQENVDPNTIRGKWLNARKKFGNLSEDDIIKGVTTAAGLTLTLTNIVNAITTIKKNRAGASEAQKELEALKIENERLTNKKLNQEIAFNNATHPDRIREQKAKADSAVMNAGIAAGSVVGKIAAGLNNAGTEESAVFDFDENGYMVESASASISNILASITADLCKVYTVVSAYSAKTLSKAQSIIGAATKGWNKPTKASKEKEKEAEDKEEKKDDEE